MKAVCFGHTQTNCLLCKIHETGLLLGQYSSPPIVIVYCCGFAQWTKNSPFSLNCFLKSHPFNKGGSEGPFCLCGNMFEDTRHFVMVCPRYDATRTTLITRLQKLNIHGLINHNVIHQVNSTLTPHAKTPVHIFN